MKPAISSTRDRVDGDFSDPIPLDEAPDGLARLSVAAMKGRETPPVPGEGACPSDTLPLGADERRRMKDASQHEPGVLVLSSADTLVRARQRAGDAVAAQLWGLHVRSRAVTQFIGETSAGKTVFLKNLAYHLATGQEFVGLTPPRPLRVLHLDFETYEDLLAEHLEAIGTAPGWDFLDLDKVQDIQRGAKFVDMIEDRVRAAYDVVIIERVRCDRSRGRVLLERVVRPQAFDPLLRNHASRGHRLRDDRRLHR